MTNEEYEIQAEAFRRATGHMAPGKDPGSTSLEARQMAWNVWLRRSWSEQKVRKQILRGDAYKVR